jgi:glutamate N-acetyltransferase/amino-acid N-acetyltransferase
MPTCVPKGYRLAGVHCGIKDDTDSPDLSLVVSDTPATAAGVYTQNQVYAAPVAVDRERTPSDRMRLVVANSGNANSCTGDQGLADAHQMGRLAAEACGAEADQALVLSTGIIGTYLPMDRIARGIETAASHLAADEDALTAAARGIMTTDTVHKIAGREISVGGVPIRITGMAKGAGMIGPNMATMLAILITDAALEPAVAQKGLKACIDESFNCVSVDGHTSTNDTVLLLANGSAGTEPLAGDDLGRFDRALGETCDELARAIAADGEGATHVIAIEVTGCADRQSAERIARAVANSPLVKTAITGHDPNWGRIVSAAGYAGVPFQLDGVRLELNGFLLYQGGTPAPFDRRAVSESIRDHHEASIRLHFREGDARAYHWTSDLTADYVRINAEYHT